MNLFATVLTHIAPSANYRGESLENVAAMQKITIGRFEYPVISPEAMRNAIREILRGYPDIQCNRERLADEEQLAVKFSDYPDAEEYADDFLMGWLIAQGSADRKKTRDELKKKGRDPEKFTFKRDSVLRMNLAVALEPFRHSTVFTQSPQQVDSPWKNAEQSQLLHRETAVTAFQYPFAINLKDCKTKKQKKWTKSLLQAIGELNGVAGNHARSYFEMAPASIVVRLTRQLVAGYDTYGFEIQDAGTGGVGKGAHLLPEIVDGITENPPDFCGSEFFLGGKLVKDLSQDKRDALQKAGVTMDRGPQRLLKKIADKMFKKEE